MGVVGLNSSKKLYTDTDVEILLASTASSLVAVSWYSPQTRANTFES